MIQEDQWFIGWCGSCMWEEGVVSVKFQGRSMILVEFQVLETYFVPRKVVKTYMEEFVVHVFKEGTVVRVV